MPVNVSGKLQGIWPMGVVTARAGPSRQRPAVADALDRAGQRSCKEAVSGLLKLVRVVLDQRGGYVTPEMALDVLRELWRDRTGAEPLAQARSQEVHRIQKPRACFS